MPAAQENCLFNIVMLLVIIYMYTARVSIMFWFTCHADVSSETVKQLQTESEHESPFSTTHAALAGKSSIIPHHAQQLLVGRTLAS